MATCKIISWNVRGLNCKVKRALVFNYLKQFNPDLFILQETHLRGQKILALKRPWIGSAYHSVYSSYARGVSVLVGKALPFQLLNLHIDQSGRYIILHASLGGREYVFAGIYIPPPFQKVVLDDIMAKVSLYPQAPFILLGDFNATLDRTLDRLHPPQTHNKALGTWALAHNLTEVWRALHPDLKQFSCFSATAQSLSRIDLAFASSDMLPQILSADYLPRGISDHAPLAVTLTHHVAAPFRLWRLNPRWLEVESVATRCVSTIEEYWRLNAHTSNPMIEWDAFKAVMRGALLQSIATYRAELREAGLNLERRLTDAEIAFINQPNPDTSSAFQEAQRKYTLHLTDYTQKKLLTQRQSIFADGDKNGRALAFLAGTETPRTFVTSLQTASGDYLSDPRDVCEQFRNYYAQLYKSRTTKAVTEISDFLARFRLPSLSRDLCDILASSISIEEIQSAIEQMASHKSPGPDGFPVEWFRFHMEFQSARLLSLFQQAFDSASLPLSFSEALIVVIHKPGKPPEHCSSYRPISLINVDAKILTKILANRLSSVILSLVDVDQSGFMPGKTTDINLRRLYTNLQVRHDNSGARVIAALDNEKAFDSVEWNFMFAVLSALGIPQNFVKWLHLIYSKPTARIRVNGYVSDPFPLERGTRQGCPLSPLLFALIMEPLAAFINQNTAIEGWSIAGITEKLSLYADDMLVYLANPNSSLDALLSTVEEFGSYSGLKVNWTKSTLCPIDDIPSQDFSTKSNLVVVDRFTYLGMVIHRDIRLFDTLNLVPTMQYITRKLNAWEGLPLTLVGRINIFKMVLLPKLLYLYRAVPHILPKLHFDAIDRVLGPFLWHKRVPRLHRNTLKAPVEHGGLALPDMYVYYVAIQLSYAAWWLRADANNPAVVLEAALVGSYEALANLVYREGKYPVPHLTTLMTATIAIWKKFVVVYGDKGADTQWSPYIPLWRNPRLPELTTVPDFEFWPQKGIKYLTQLYHEGCFRSFADLQQSLNLPRSAMYRYFQLRHACAAQFGGREITLECGPLELVARRVPLLQPVSAFYKTIMLCQESPLDMSFQKWQDDIPSLAQHHIRELKSSWRTSVISARDRLIQAKWLHRTYFTPVRLFRMGKLCSDMCSRCGVERGTLIHMIWECPVIQAFWGEVHGFLNTKLGLPGVCAPTNSLLGLVEELIPTKYGRILYRLLMFYARKTILLNWKPPKQPFISHWLALINADLTMYKLTFAARGTPDRFLQIWDLWIVAQTSLP